MALLRGASARSHFARLRYWPHCHAVAGTSEATSGTTCRALPLKGFVIFYNYPSISTLQAEDS